MRAFSAHVLDGDVAAGGLGIQRIAHVPDPDVPAGRLDVEVGRGLLDPDIAPRRLQVHVAAYRAHPDVSAGRGQFYLAADIPERHVAARSMTRHVAGQVAHDLDMASAGAQVQIELRGQVDFETNALASFQRPRRIPRIIIDAQDAPFIPYPEILCAV